MPARSLNKVQLIGNLTRDPELRYTPQGTAVCTFGIATNRSWMTESGEKKEDTEFHRAVAWNKLGELCSQLLFKGRKVFVEGRLQTRQWTGQDGVSRQTTEIVVSDMIILDSRRAPGEETGAEIAPEEHEVGPNPESMNEVALTEDEGIKSTPAQEKKIAKAETVKAQEEANKAEEAAASDEVKPEDIPF